MGVGIYRVGVLIPAALGQGPAARYGDLLLADAVLPPAPCRKEGRVPRGQGRKREAPSPIRVRTENWLLSSLGKWPRERWAEVGYGWERWGMAARHGGRAEPKEQLAG